MDYAKLYNDLISFRKSNPLVKSKELYTEKHHIIPRCLGGSDDDENLVRLTAREHFIAHRILSKMYPESQSIQYAVLMMVHTRDGFKVVSSKEFSKLTAIASKRKSSIATKLWEDPKHRSRISESTRLQAHNQWKDPKHRNHMSKTNSSLIKNLWETEEYAVKTNDGRQKWLKDNPWPWQRARAQGSKHIWTLAVTYWEMFVDPTLTENGKGYGSNTFSREFCNGMYFSIFRRMRIMFETGWVPHECEEYMKEFGHKC